MGGKSGEKVKKKNKASKVRDQIIVWFQQTASAYFCYVQQ